MDFLCYPKGERIVAALSIRLTVRPSHFCPEHISKSIEGNLMKLDTLIEGHEGNRRIITITLSPVFAELLPFLIFAVKRLFGEYL